MRGGLSALPLCRCLFLPHTHNHTIHHVTHSSSLERE